MKTISITTLTNIKFLGSNQPKVGGHVAIGADGQVKMHCTAKNLESQGASIFMMNARGNNYEIRKITQ